MLDRIATSLLGRPVNVIIVCSDQSVWYGHDIVDSLIARGVNVRMTSMVSKHDPERMEPLAFELNENWARQVISPETQPR